MKQTCPACNAEITSDGCEDVTLNARPRRPKEGDLVVCPVCARVSIIADARLVLLAPAHVQTLKPDVRAAIQQAQRRVRSTVN